MTTVHVKVAVWTLVMLAALGIAIYFGVEKRSWWDRHVFTSWGGGLGVLGAIVFFIKVAVSVGAATAGSAVAIPAAGILALFFFSGTGVGAVFDLARDLITKPSDFEYHWVRIAAVLILGGFIAHLASQWAVERFLQWKRTGRLL